MSLQDQTVIVTGAAQGIGECVARHLVNKGAKVLLADIQEDKVSNVAEELGCESVHVDIAEPDSARSMVEYAIAKLNHIDALVNVAGIDAPFIDALDVSDEHWRKLIDVDLNGPWWCTTAVLPHMVKRGNGRVVIISSASGIVGDLGVSPAYAAAKAGLFGLVISLSMNIEQYGVLVNGIAPGTIGTTGAPMTDEYATKYLADFPLGFGGPQPVADAVSYLLDDSGNWISGAVLNVSGGGVRGR